MIELTSATTLILGIGLLLIFFVLLSAALCFLLWRQKKEIAKLSEMCKAKRMDEIVKEVGELKKIEIPEDAFKAFFAKIQDGLNEMGDNK